ncbi:MULTISPECIES: hypothetical protein [Ruegeria]|uniref:hypothetical protein n=1 Tax=Ruegeria TaxID=97050 RepID=UPI0020C35777|nr:MULTISPECIES: hypothetical protein [Ruegeria]UUV06336.1 hypothetical protein NOR97_00895 [Ruegeria sp. YS9]
MAHPSRSNPEPTSLSTPRHTATAARLLLVLVASFVTLVPGGPIETRDFSGLGGGVFWGFNAFLIALALLAVGSAVAMLRGSVAAGWGAIVAAWGYVFVVLLDLGHVFPTSPDPIPLMLGLVEILDFVLALYVLALVHRSLGHI